MVKINDIREGNYHEGQEHSHPRRGIVSVKINGKPFSSITAYGIYVVSKGEMTFEPIPITKEWLLALGFEECLNDKVLGDYQIIIGKPSPSNGLFIIYSFEDQSCCLGQLNHFSHQFGQYKYVHEIQNLYYSIAMRELILKV